MLTYINNILTKSEGIVSKKQIIENYKNVWIAFVIMLLLLASVCIILAVMVDRNKGYMRSLESQYQRAYMELIDNVDDIEVDLSKVVATTNLVSQQKLLQSINLRCTMASSNIANLPIDSASLSNVNTLINKIGGYVFSFIESEKLMGEAELKNIENLHQSVSIVKYDLNKGLEKNIAQAVSIVDTSNKKSDNKFTAGLVNEEMSYSSIPSLIYDGPFSESVINKEPKELRDVVDENTARQNVLSLSNIWGDFDIDYLGVTDGKLATYNYKISSGEWELYIQVLQNGGILLSATGYGDYKGDTIDKFEAIKMAKNIAYQFGYGDMVEVWNQLVGNVLYINLAYTEDGVIYYGDLVKVKIDLAGGEIVGWEGSNYVYSHHDRSNYVSALGLSEGQKLLSPSLKVIERNYCVIPNEYVGESDAYEYVCECLGYTYYVYLSSTDGQELNILRVVETNNGALLQ